LKFLLDEHMNATIQVQLREKHPEFVVERVVDVLALGTSDEDILEWAALHDYLVVSKDISTLKDTAYRRVEEGLPMPGAMIIRHRASLGQIMENLELVIVCGNPSDFANYVTIVPFPFRQ
jgi:hypothetical protein